MESRLKKLEQFISGNQHFFALSLFTPRHHFPLQDRAKSELFRFRRKSRAPAAAD
jgi:hypothetical protein